jgi:hypothetical protein
MTAKHRSVTLHNLIWMIEHCNLRRSNQDSIIYNRAYEIILNMELNLWAENTFDFESLRISKLVKD